MLNVTPASGPPLQIRSEEVSFFQNLCLISLFVSVSPCLSSALSIHPPDATWRSRSIKRDVQFPAPSPSEENKGSACCFSHCWPMSTSHRSLRCVRVCCQLCTCVSLHQLACVWVHSNMDSWIPLNHYQAYGLCAQTVLTRPWFACEGWWQEYKEDTTTVHHCPCYLYLCLPGLPLESTAIVSVSELLHPWDTAECLVNNVWAF